MRENIANYHIILITEYKIPILTMNKSLLLLFSFSILASCSKWDTCHKENKCPVVSQDQVPLPVTESFNSRYPDTPVSIWYNKDEKGYCAFFESQGQVAKANFGNNGSFLSEELHEGRNHHKKMHENDGCVCEP